LPQAFSTAARIAGSPNQQIGKAAGISCPPVRVARLYASIFARSVRTKNGPSRTSDTFHCLDNERGVDSAERE
jgi:hypothetical protein